MTTLAKLFLISSIFFCSVLFSFGQSIYLKINPYKDSVGYIEPILFDLNVINQDNKLVIIEEPNAKYGNLEIQYRFGKEAWRKINDGSTSLRGLITIPTTTISVHGKYTSEISFFCCNSNNSNFKVDSLLKDEKHFFRIKYVYVDSKTKAVKEVFSNEVRIMIVPFKGIDKEIIGWFEKNDINPRFIFFGIQGGIVQDSLKTMKYIEYIRNNYEGKSSKILDWTKLYLEMIRLSISLPIGKVEISSIEIIPNYMDSIELETKSKEFKKAYKETQELKKKRNDVIENLTLLMNSTFDKSLQMHIKYMLNLPNLFGL